ncbi:hypothetical protein EJV47_00005 [Hymenobacter gummosus]|uniref:Uncharacterized protein n=1 Tax=Hymenobacter gummosus TaxID=1776032 RepID=A0A431U7J4_9BACT|nr:hypothetical protein [Hymenobacter gummosus]RTQ53161.1 hypothetical protein EJV47_00005 [Hymenobacter gummosus]
MIRLFRARLRANGQRLERLPDIELHPALAVHSLLLDGDWLYLGGGVNQWAYQNLSNKELPAGEYFSRLRLSDTAPTLIPIPLPVAFGPGKAIDDLQRDAYGQLLVLDNILMPKYLFFYRLQGGEPPTWANTHKLPFARVNETYKRASWNEQFIVLLSGSVGMGGSGRYISVLRRSDLKPVWFAGMYRWHRFDWDEMTKPSPYLFDAVVCGSKVVFAAGLGGLGYAELPLVPWPRRRASYGTYEYWPNGRDQPGAWKRNRPYEFEPELDLHTVGPTSAAVWLSPAPEQPAIVETVRVAHQNVLVLTGRAGPGELEVCWTHLI